MESKNIVLLTVAPHKKSFVPVNDKRIPLNIAVLLGLLNSQGYNVNLIDNYLKENNWLDEIEKSSVDYVGLYLIHECWGNAQNYLNELKSIKNVDGNDRFKIIVFGPFATLNPELIPDGVDFVITGCFESAFESILEGKVEDKVILGQLPDNLDNLVRPYWENFIPEGNPLDCEYDLTEVALGNIFPVFDLKTVKGKQNNLNYCFAKDIQNNSACYMSASKIIEYIEYLINNYDAKGLRILDYNFASNKDRLIEFCSLMIESGLKLSWMCNIKPGSVDKKLLSLMKEAGCSAIKISADSGSQRILDYINAEFDVNNIKELIKIAKDLNIKTKIKIIYGWPTESELDRKQTEVLIEWSKADYTDVRIFVGIPKTFLCDEVLNFPHRIDENGLIIPYQWESIAKKYLGISSYSGDYSDKPIVSNPIPSVMFYKKKDYIEDKLNLINSIPLKKKIYFYGAGELAKSFVKKYKIAEYNIKGFFDNDLSKCGKFRPTKFTIYHESEIKKLAPDYIFITMASKEDSIKVKNAIMSDLSILKKPEIYSIFYEEL
ncbi:MAG: radical SAM protein [Cyanobacteriota bacterium]